MANTKQSLVLRLGGFNSGSVGFAIRSLLADKTAIDEQNSKTAESIFGRFVDRKLAMEYRENLKRENLGKVEVHFRKARIQFIAKNELLARQMVDDYISPKHEEICSGHKFVVVTNCGIEGHQQCSHMHIEHQWREHRNV